MKKAIITLICLFPFWTVYIFPEPITTYTGMSQKEAREILQKSPWSHECRWDRVYGGDDHYHLTKSTRSPMITIHVQLFSSHPIRHAYAILAANGNNALLKKYEYFATQNFEDKIVVSWKVDCNDKTSTAYSDLMEILRNETIAELKPNTFLVTDSGTKVFITDYIPPTADGTGAKFVFPRFLKNGSPLLTESDTSFAFRTKPLQIGVRSARSYLQRNCQGRAINSGMKNLIDELKETQNSTLSIQATYKLKDLKYHGKVNF